MDTTVEGMSNALDDWVAAVEEKASEVWEEKKTGSPGSTIDDYSWLNCTKVVDLDVTCLRSGSTSSHGATVEELRRARDTFVSLSLIESQQCRGPRNGLSSVQSMISLLEPLSSDANPPLFEMLPWMDAFRESQGLDWADSNDQQKAIYNDLECKLAKWEQRHPVILRYI